MPIEGAPVSLLGRHGLLAGWVVIFAVALAGCSSAAETPLGGPYGGVTGTVGPTDGSVPARPRINDPLGDQPSDGTGSDSGITSTFTQLFDKYLAAKTVGNCTHCHSEMDSASDSYVWLKTRGYLGSPNPFLIDPEQSCLSWYGGSMPPGGPEMNARAVRDMDGWAAAGAKND
jgi:hypothetical protein